MATLIPWLSPVVSVSYILVVAVYLILFLKNAAWTRRLATPLAWATLAAHALLLVAVSISYRHVPVASMWEAFSAIAFALTLVYLLLEARLKNKATGAFLLVFPLLFHGSASVFGSHSPEVNEILRSPWFGVHVAAAMVGYAAFAIAAAYGVLYLWLYRELKSKRMGLVFKRLPNLESLAWLNWNALCLGWCALTIAIGVGIPWAMSLRARGDIQNPFTDPKFISGIIVWTIYAVCLHGRFVAHWSTRRVVRVSIVAFVLLVLSSFVVDLFLSSFHAFT